MCVASMLSWSALLIDRNAGCNTTRTCDSHSESLTSMFLSMMTICSSWACFCRKLNLPSLLLSKLLPFNLASALLLSRAGLFLPGFNLERTRLMVGAESFDLAQCSSTNCVESIVLCQQVMAVHHSHRPCKGLEARDVNSS